jgi:hypothetical protein
MKIEQTTDDITAEFTVPFTKEALKNDILEVMLTLINQTRFTFFRDDDTDNQMWALLSKTPTDHDSEVANPDMEPKDLGLTFFDIENIEMVRNLMQFYDYGVHGILDASKPDIDDSDGGGNWTSRILYDLRRSSFLQDWCAYKSAYKSDEICGAVDRCLFVAELANARLMLEGAREGFFLGMQLGDTLSIRQMSLLSGMTEASIRTLAGPNRKNRLITKKDGNNTVIGIEDAKAWLIAKGRYVPVKRTSTQGEEDFTKRKFTSIAEFENAVFERRAFLNVQQGEDVIDSRILNAGVKSMKSNPSSEIMRMDSLGEHQLLDVALMSRLGEALELPKALFALRASEAATVEKLRIIEQALKQAK